MNNYSVYMHTNKINGKKYVGITSIEPRKRWRNGWGYYSNTFFMSAIKKYGWDNFEHKVLFVDLDLETACAIEKDLIAKYKTCDRKYGYNRSTGGEQPAEGHTYKASEETRKRISESNKGIRRSDEARARISAGKKGKSNGREGKLGKECAKAKIIYQITINGDVIGEFYGAYEVTRIFGFSSPCKIYDVCNGKRKTAYGYKWKYKEG